MARHNTRIGQDVSLSLFRGQYGLCILLVNWSPGIIALLHMIAYHRYMVTKESLLKNGCF